MSSAVPDWCEVRRGSGRVLLVAPHGGRRPPIDPLAPPANLRVNDVYTPEVTRALAERLGAGAIINRGVDRNHIDLNRATQVRKRAPWFLDLLEREVADVVERHGECEVLFIHGWNNGQLKCDIGLGGVERDGEIVAPPDRCLSVGREYLAGRVEALRRACESRGICAPLGEKYPASHPNNLVQLFAARPGADDLLAGFAAARQVNALQLELTLPLRCPGEWREAFLDAVAEAYGAGRDNARTRMGDARASVSGEGVDDAPPAGAESLQFYDADAGIGVFAGVGRMGPKSMGGRLLLFLGGQRIALFTGEEMGMRGVPPLRFERRGSTVALRFHGPILMIEDAAEYLDLEAALAASTAVEADLAVDFQERSHAASSATFGEVRGELRLDGRRFALETHGFGHVAGLRAAGVAQTMLAASFDGGRALVGRLAHDTDTSSIIHFRGDDFEILDSLRLEVIEDGDAYTPRAFELVSPTQPRLRAVPINRMAILRGAPQGYIRVAFGVARFDWDGAVGYGLYEHALPLPAATPA